MRGAVGAIEIMLIAIEERMQSKADFVDLQCLDSDPKFLFELTSRPWAHVKMESLDEKKKENY